MRFTWIYMNEEYLQQHIMILTLNRSERLNAVNDILLSELREAINFVANQPEIKVLIINSNVLEAFCTGIDVTYVKELKNEQVAIFFAKLAEVLKCITHLSKPTIAVIHGYAFGFGADLALACDLRIGSETSLFRFPGPQFGLILGTERLIGEIGPALSRYLTLTNKVLKAEDALQIGLLHEVVDGTQVMESVVKRAFKLAQMPEYTLKKIKELTNDNGNQDASIDMTKNSVLVGDFQQRFRKFLNK